MKILRINNDFQNRTHRRIIWNLIIEDKLMPNTLDIYYTRKYMKKLKEKIDSNKV